MVCNEPVIGVLRKSILRIQIASGPASAVYKSARIIICLFYWSWAGEREIHELRAVFMLDTDFNRERRRVRALMRISPAELLHSN